jgi:O-antigen biosynthesis protein WbqV
LRPGEKLHEELFHDEEELVPTEQPGLRLATPRAGDPELLRRSLEALVAAADSQDTAHTLELLGRAVPEWRRDAAVIPLAPSRAQTATDAGAAGEQT